MTRIELALLTLSLAIMAMTQLSARPISWLWKSKAVESERHKKDLLL